MTNQAAKKLEEANQTRKKWWLFGPGKYEEAAEHYDTASNLFRIDGQSKEAAEASIHAALMYLRANQKYEAANSYIKAAALFQSIDPSKSINLYNSGITLYAELGKFRIIPKYYETIAAIYEEMLDFDKAIENYRSAADNYEIENNSSPLQKCFIKIAELSVTREEYDRAIEAYQRVVQLKAATTITKWDLPRTFLQMGLCYLVNQDLIGLKRCFLQWKELSPIFANSRELRFLSDLITALEEINLDHFSEICREYDSLSTLDSFMVTLLIRIKNTFHSSTTQ